MKEEIKKAIDSKIESFNAFVDDAYIENVENRPILNIVVDSSEVIDLDKITEISRVINDVIDNENIVNVDFDELDVYAKSKGGEDYE